MGELSSSGSWQPGNRTTPGLSGGVVTVGKWASGQVGVASIIPLYITWMSREGRQCLLLHVCMCVCGKQENCQAGDVCVWGVRGGHL